MAYILSILESFLGPYARHNEDTGQISFDCCACEDGLDKGNLEINYHKDVFKCWVCKDTNHMYGSITRLIKKYGTHKNLRDYRLFKPDVDYHAEKVPVVVHLPEGFKLLKECTPKDYKYSAAINYLSSRGITNDIIEKYNIGYTTQGDYFNRIIIPSYDEDGELNYFVARWFDKAPTKVKYLNPDAEKQTIIINEKLINWDATIYLVEGMTDHIVTPNSIPLLGKYISNILIDKLYENAQGLIVILLDGDAREDAEFLYQKLNFGKLRGRIRICTTPDGYDPSLIHEKMGRKGVIKLLQSATKL